MAIDSNDEGKLLADVGRKLAIPAEEEVGHIVDAVADALGELLTIDEASLIAYYLPNRWAVLLVEAAQRDVRAGLPQLIEGISWRENVPLGSALEHATAVCESFGRLLPADVGERLHADLPGQVADLLEPRHLGLPPSRRTLGRPEPTPATLADGRPGSAKPLSRARPDGAHSQSVAANDDPHGDTKLSGARGLTQERHQDSLAAGRAGPRRTVAGS